MGLYDQPKRCGGMGFRDLQLFNQALLAKQAWRLIEYPDSLCAQVLMAKYYPNGVLIDTVFTGNALSTWKAIEYGLELLKKGIVWRIGNGAEVRIWRDPWIPRGPSCRLITLRGRCHLKGVAELLRTDGTWNTTLLHQYFHQADIEEIVKIKRSQRLETDFVAWFPDKKGHFSVKSAYSLGL